MRIPKAGIAALIAAACLCGAMTQPLAYTVITRDGHRIVTTTEPEVRGLHVFMRLEPHGQLVVIQEVRIDWEKTEAVNPSNNEIVVPADTELVEGLEQEGTTAPTLHSITGTKVPGASPAREPTTEAESTPDDPYAAEALAHLRREHGKLSSLRNEAVESRRVMENELQDLRGRMVRQASSDGADERRAQELQLLIDGIRRRISKYDNRIDDIKAEAIRHGGTID